MTVLDRTSPLIQGEGQAASTSSVNGSTPPPKPVRPVALGVIPFDPDHALALGIAVTLIAVVLIAGALIVAVALNSVRINGRSLLERIGDALDS